jgi:undecaprenyl-diphosphatase
MTIIQCIIIAIIEGITEFLPISSTAHMKFANPLLHIGNDAFSDMFEIVIQLAAILSVVVLYWRKYFDFKNFNFYVKLMVAVLPALIFGYFLNDLVDASLDNLPFIACVMIAGGIILLFIDKFFKHSVISEESQISMPKAIAIGCFQVLAVIFPGLSRSAATIIGGLSQKLTRNLAAEFSFFLAVPTMFAASAKSFWDTFSEHPEVINSENMGILGIGSLVSFLVAMAAVKFLISHLQKHGFRLFGWYRIALGTVILILVFTGVIK